MRIVLEPGELAALIVQALAEPEVRRALQVALKNSGMSGDRLAPALFAERWGVSRRTVAGWIAGGLPVIRVGRVVRITTAAGDAWVAGQGRRSPDEKERGS